METTFDTKKNNSLSTLLSNHTSGSGTIVIQSGDQTKFPSTFPFRITVYIANTTLASPQTAGTIFYVNSASSNTFNVTVPSDESPASVDQNFTVGGTYPINVECDWTYGGVKQHEVAINDLESETTVIQTDTGSANTYAITPSPAFSSYVAGQTFTFYPAHANTGASTLNVNGLGTKTIQYNGNALISGQLKTTTLVTVQYDGTYFQLKTPVLVTNSFFVNPTSGVSTQNITTAAGNTAITTMTGTLVTTGGNVQVNWSIPFYVSAGNSVDFTIQRDGTSVTWQNLNPDGSGITDIAGGSFMDQPTAGSHTYTMYVLSNAGSQSVTVVYSQGSLSAEERKA